MILDLIGLATPATSIVLPVGTLVCSTTMSTMQPVVPRYSGMYYDTLLLYLTLML